VDANEKFRLYDDYCLMAGLDLDPADQRFAATCPMFSSGWRMVVNCGIENAALGKSSNPMTEISSGTRRPTLKYYF
jgi:hypothetical protein